MEGLEITSRAVGNSTQVSVTLSKDVLTESELNEALGQITKEIKQHVRCVKISDMLVEVLERDSHLDATHVGNTGNPYLYLYSELDNLLYTFIDEEGWVLCDWSNHDAPKEYQLRDLKEISIGLQ